LFGWAFTLTKFARIYSEKFKVDQEKMMKKLWGDNYFDQKAKKWKVEEVADDGEKLRRCFVQFIMEPVIRLCRNIMDGNRDAVFKMLNNLEIVLKTEEKDLEGKALFKNVF
jgi:elongation factor 2